MGILQRKNNQEISREKTLQEENLLLKSSLSYLKEEVNKFKQTPAIVCEVRRTIEDKAVIKMPNNHLFLVNIANNIGLKEGDTVLVEQKSLTVIQKLDKLHKQNVETFLNIEKPQIQWSDIGGMEEEKRQIQEVVELPLKKPELFQKIGIEPPKGILLYGPPGTGKTMLAKAVATASNATFIEIVASELVQKYIGEGAKLVKEIFNLARKKAPSIVFIDEIDALAAERVDMGVSGEREVQRTFMQLLAEIDGFQNLSNVKIIAATNRFEILDSAITRPGRFDRLIETSYPNEQGREDIIKIHTEAMNNQKLDITSIVDKTEGLSGAELKAICTEAGYVAIRNNKDKVVTQHFEEAIDRIVHTTEDESAAMFG